MSRCLFPQCFPQLWKSWGRNRSLTASPPRPWKTEAATVAQGGWGFYPVEPFVDTLRQARLVLKVLLRASRAHADDKTAIALADAALKKFGRIDILVNNAALRREKHVSDMSLADWREVMNVILDGTFRCVHACLPALRKNGGSIINIGGMSAHIGSKDRVHVMTAKSALVGLSRGLAHDLAADRVTANCVVPGAIDTTRPATSQNPAHHLTHGTITGERGKPQDVAAMVRFLCGPNGRYVTGQTIHVSGGAYLGS